MARFELHQSLKAAYDGYYADGAHAEWRRLGAVDKVRNIVDLCGDEPHGSLLEIGAGEGSVIRRLADIGFAERLEALDVSVSAVDAIGRLGIDGLKAQVFDGYSLPYGEDAFDLVVMTNLVEHLEYPRRLIYEAARVGKALFIEVPLEHTVRMPRDYRPSVVGHINFYSDKSIRRLVQSCGLEIVCQRITNPRSAVFCYRLGSWGLPIWAVRETVMRVAPVVAKSLFTYHCAILCRQLAEGKGLMEA